MIELSADHPSSHDGIPVLLIDGEPFGPTDSIEHTSAAARYGGILGREPTAGYLIAVMANLRGIHSPDDEEFVADCKRFCAQWPEGPQPDSAEVHALANKARKAVKIVKDWIELN